MSIHEKNETVFQFSYLKVERNCEIILGQGWRHGGHSIPH